MGRISAGKQDLRRWVGIGSREHEASEDLEIARVILSEVAAVNKLSCGGIIAGGDSIEEVVMLGINLDDILLILSRKNSEKLDAIVREHEKIGRMLGGLRERSESRSVHNCLGLYWFSERKLLK